MDWSAECYCLFEEERTRAVRDLVAALPHRDVVGCAVDLGCGPGNSTEVLKDRFPQAKISGLDSSVDMIEAARRRLPTVCFEVADIQTWEEREPCDVILANAVLHWVPHHGTLLPLLMKKLAPKGILAIQMPDNLNEPTHQLMHKIALEGPWASRLTKVLTQRTTIEAAEWYYTVLQPFCKRIDIWRTVYYYPLAEGVKDVINWFKGSGLRPFLALLEEKEQESFLSRYTEAIEQAYPLLSDGTLLLPFPRLFIIGENR